MTAVYIAVMTVGLVASVPLIARTRDGQAPTVSFTGAAGFFALTFGPLGIAIRQFELRFLIEVLLVFAVSIAVAILHSDILRGLHRGDGQPPRSQLHAHD